MPVVFCLWSDVDVAVEAEVGDEKGKTFDSHFSIVNVVS